jgi:hypothetical protein
VVLGLGSESTESVLGRGARVTSGSRAMSDVTLVQIRVGVGFL